MSHEVSIRRFREGDLDALSALVRAAWEGITYHHRIETTFGEREKPWWRYKLDGLEQRAREQPEQFFIAQVEDEVVGYATYSLDSERRIGTVTDNAVLPAYRGRGVGSMLHEAVLHEIRANRMELAVLETGAGDSYIYARRMYEQHGFEEFDRTVRYAMRLDGEVRWTGSGDGRAFNDARNWSPRVVPGRHDRACFGVDATVIIDSSDDEPVEIGRIEAGISDEGSEEAAQKRPHVTLTGSGRIVLTGADRLPGKPVSLQVANGRLEIASGLSIDVAAPRFAAHAGGTLVLASERVSSVLPDLKIAISHTGAIVVNAPTWDSQMHLDLATGRTSGLGPHVLEFAGVHRPQRLSFLSLKEHDGDPVEIRGYQSGDSWSFEMNPFESGDPGKELVLDQIRFPGWPDDGRASVSESSGRWYIHPASEQRDEWTPVHERQPEDATAGSIDIGKPVYRDDATRETPCIGGCSIGEIDNDRLFAVWRAGKSREASLRAAIFERRDEDIVTSGHGFHTELQVPGGSAGQPNVIARTDGSLLIATTAFHGNGDNRLVAGEMSRSGLDSSDEQWNETIGWREVFAAPGLLVANNRFVRLCSGRLLLPASIKSDSGALAGCLISDDDGRTFRAGEGWVNYPGRACGYPSAVALPDGITVLFVSTHLHRIYRAESSDDGEHWTHPEEVTRLISPESPAAFVTASEVASSVDSGILGCWNHNSRGAVGPKGRANEVPIEEIHGRDRMYLSLGLSGDAGHSWQTVYRVAGEDHHTYSYPAIHQCGGRQLISYNDGAEHEGMFKTSLVVRPFPKSFGGTDETA